MKFFALVSLVLLIAGCEIGGSGIEEEVTSVLCSDDFDNDMDGKIDCDDPDCAGFVFCTNYPLNGNADSDNERDTSINPGDSEAPNNTLPNNNTIEERESSVYQWVLRDKDDNDVYGVLTPYPYYPEIAFQSFSPTCVYVSEMNNQSILLHYSLATGKPSDCEYYTNYSSWRDVPTSVFADSNCSGQAYLFSTIGESGAHYQRHKVNGVMYYTDKTTGTLTTPISYFNWDTTTNTCIQYIQTTTNYSLWKFVPIPDWVNNLLPDAPYTLSGEYQ